jgi:hypothetical protein
LHSCTRCDGDINKVGFFDSTADISCKHIESENEVYEINLNTNNFVSGKLLNGKKLSILVDSGASKSVISRGTINASDYLQNCKQEKSTNHYFKVGNGEFLVSNTAITFNIKIQGHTLQLTALIVDYLGGVDILLGNKSLIELDATLNFKTRKLTFKSKQIPVYLKRGIKVKANNCIQAAIEAKLPNCVKNAEFVFKPTLSIGKFVPSNALLKFRKKNSVVLISNNSSTDLSLNANKPIGILQTTEFACIMNTCKLTEVEISNDINYVANEQNNDVEKVLNSIDLSNSTLKNADRKRLINIINKNYEAFSINDQVGNSNLKISFQLEDDTPFYIRPFTVSESEKPIIDNELNKLVKLGVLTKGRTNYTSPIMLLKKPNSTGKRLVTDFRYLNTKIRQQNHPFPLVREAINIIGNSDCRFISTLDLKHAFYSLQVHEDCQKYLGISSYAGGNSYIYKRMPQGLNISPSYWQNHIDNVLSEIDSKEKFCLAIADDLIVFSKTAKQHIAHLECILQTLRKHGLKISPEKCKLAQTKIDYMGHTILMDKNKPVSITPQKSKIEAISKLPVPKTPKQTKGFIGAVNFLSMYLPHLQTLLAPLYNLTKKNVKFEWLDEHQIAFDKIKELLQKRPILTMPKAEGLIRVYSDTSQLSTGASIFQIQNGEERLIGYHSKKLPEACKRYGISELELTGIYLNIYAFRYLLRNVSFEVYTDHSSLCHILKSKAEPPNDRFKKLIEKLSAYSFKIGYKKGSELYLADYLSRNAPDNDIPNEFTAIAFSAQDNLLPVRSEIERPMTRAYAKSKGISVKPLFKEDELKESTTTIDEHNKSQPVSDPHVSVDIATRNTGHRQSRVNTSSANNPNVQLPTPMQHINSPTVTSNHMQSNLYDKTSLVNTNINKNGSYSPNFRNLLPDCEQTKTTSDNFETYTKPDEYYYNTNKPLIDNIKDTGILRSHIPKQTEIDKMLAIIKKKVLRDYHLPINIREIRASQESDDYLGPVLKFLEKTYVPTNKLEYKRLTNICEEFIIVNSILFKLNTNKNSECKVMLAIPDKLVPVVFNIYHDSLLANHQGINRTYQTIRKRFYIQNLFQKLYDYIRTCNLCQHKAIHKSQNYEYVPRIPSDFRPMRNISVDIKHMVTSYTGHKYLLIAVCSISRFCVAEPLIKADAINIAEVILNRIVFRFGPPETITIDSDRALENKIMDYLYNSLKIKVNVISPYNHGSLHVERFIGSIANLILANMTDTGENWSIYVQCSVFSYNIFSIPSLGNFSPHYLVHLQDIRDFNPLNISPVPKMQDMNAQTYVQLLRDRLNTVAKLILDRQAENQNIQCAKQKLKLDNKISNSFSKGTIIYLLAPTSSSLQCASRKLRLDFVGPLYISEMLDKTHAILSDLTGKILQGVYHVRRIKPGFIRSDDGVITNIGQLRKSIDKNDDKTNIVYKIQDESGDSETMLPEDSLIFSTIEVINIDLQRCKLNANLNNNLACENELSSKAQSKSLKILEKAKLLQGDYIISKGRFKNGSFEFLVRNLENKQISFWIPIKNHPVLMKLFENLSEMKLRIVGSLNRFFKACYY